MLHGDARRGEKTAEFRIWSGMISRCYNSYADGFEHYGGRGIRVSRRWLRSYSRFLGDMGRRPSSRHSIDRIDVNGHYEPSNCHWATPAEQGRNRRNNKFLTLYGETKSYDAWAETTGINRTTLLMRVKAGWSDQEALEHPLLTLNGNGCKCPGCKRRKLERATRKLGLASGSPSTS
jgi:hypothetical protein